MGNTRKYKGEMLHARLWQTVHSYVACLYATYCTPDLWYRSISCS